MDPTYAHFHQHDAAPGTLIYDQQKESQRLRTVISMAAVTEGCR